MTLLIGVLKNRCYCIELGLIIHAFYGKKIVCT